MTDVAEHAAIVMQHELPPELTESLSASITMDSLSRFCSRSKSVSSGAESTSAVTSGPTGSPASPSASSSASASSAGAAAQAVAASGKPEWRTSSEAVNEALGLFVGHVVDVLVWGRRFPALPHDRRKLLELVRFVLERVLSLDAAAISTALAPQPQVLPQVVSREVTNESSERESVPLRTTPIAKQQPAS